ncbi:unnamed protein product [Moneuplotes crassus]|uniref:Uncharacterized protein n=1 Tax=Euplotes crassus TaxID=5936 RepID=A0AAD1X601_EUPCR|nr:unnamed protein product [Moneuplotes crassus]
MNLQENTGNNIKIQNFMNNLPRASENARPKMTKNKTKVIRYPKERSQKILQQKGRNFVQNLKAIDYRNKREKMIARSLEAAGNDKFRNKNTMKNSIEHFIGIAENAAGTEGTNSNPPDRKTSKFGETQSIDGCDLWMTQNFHLGRSLELSNETKSMEKKFIRFSSTSKDFFKRLDQSIEVNVNEGLKHMNSFQKNKLKSLRLSKNSLERSLLNAEDKSIKDIDYDLLTEEEKEVYNKRIKTKLIEFKKKSEEIYPDSVRNQQILFKDRLKFNKMKLQTMRRFKFQKLKNDGLGTFKHLAKYEIIRSREPKVEDKLLSSKNNKSKEFVKFLISKVIDTKSKIKTNEKKSQHFFKNTFTNQRNFTQERISGAEFKSKFIEKHNKGLFCRKSTYEKIAKRVMPSIRYEVGKS